MAIQSVTLAAIVTRGRLLAILHETICNTTAEMLAAYYYYFLLFISLFLFFYPSNKDPGD